MHDHHHHGSAPLSRFGMVDVDERFTGPSLPREAANRQLRQLKLLRLPSFHHFGGDELVPERSRSPSSPRRRSWPPSGTKASGNRWDLPRVDHAQRHVGLRSGAMAVWS